jgi:aspartate carbamoyltransferase
MALAELYRDLEHSPEKIDGSFYGKDILSLEQFDTDSIDHLFDITENMRDIAKNARPDKTLEGTLSYLLFYEPSSRTRGSFDAAIKQLGGQTVVEGDPIHYSSVAKGESFEDTIRTYEAYSDAIVLRHPEVGFAKHAADTAKHIPIINAGDGVGEHPTQALLDLFTIHEHAGKLDNLVGVAGGDIKNGRTIHSLLKGLSLYPGNTMYLLSPHELKLSPNEIRENEQKGLEIREIESMDQIPKDADFWYWTRVQKERIPNLGEEQYHNLKNKFVVTEENFKRLAGERTGLMHPLPRVGEISEAVDKDLRALYLRNQVRNGMYVRMALMGLVLGKIK